MKDFRGSIAWLPGSRPTYHEVGCPSPRKTRFQVLVRLSWAGFHPQGSCKRFPTHFMLVFLLFQACLAQSPVHPVKRSGLMPKVVITDGSELYPKLLAELWPDAHHQLCVFHVLRDINKHVLDALRRMRRELVRRGSRGRHRRRGRPSKAQRAYRKRRKKLLKDKAHFVYKHRHLIVKCAENLREHERKRLQTMLEYLPGLRVLRNFAERVCRMLEVDQSEHQAYCRRAALLRNAAFAKVPELAKAMKMLDEARFAKMIAFLKIPAAKRIRTNNHVERANRKLRYYEKVRYKWRRRRATVRFLLLAIDRWWREQRCSSQVTGRPRRTGNSCQSKTTRRRSNSKPCENASYNVSV